MLSGFRAGVERGRGSGSDDAPARAHHRPPDQLTPETKDVPT